MKKMLGVLVSMIMISMFITGGCAPGGGSSGGGGPDGDSGPSCKVNTSNTAGTMSYADWISQPISWPAWAGAENPNSPFLAGNPTPTDTDLLNAFLVMYSPAGKSTEDLCTSVKQIRWLVESYPDSSLINIAKLMNAGLLEHLREDHTAYKLIEEVEATGETEVTVPDRGTLHYNETTDPILTSVFSRQGFIPEMEGKITDIDTFTAGDPSHDVGDYLPQISKAYFVTEDLPSLTSRLGILGTDAEFSHPEKMASSAVGAASFYFRLGDYAKVIEETEWMITAGYNSGTYIENFGNDYRVDQWNSSFTQVLAWRTMASDATANPINRPGFTGLNDGTWSFTEQGFRGPIDIDVTVTDGKLSSVDVSGDAEDRVYTALDLIPALWTDRQSLIIDGITGATVTAAAIELGIMKGLIEAAK